MPSGSLVQIVAQGSQDIFLTAIPETTFFKTTYYRHTNFAIEQVEVDLDGTADFDNQVTTVIPKNGDLIHKIWLKITLPSVNIVASQIIDTTEVANLKNNISIVTERLTRYKTFFNYNFIILNALNLEIKAVGGNWTSVQSLIANKKLSYSTVINSIDVSLDDVITRFETKFPISVKNQYIGSTEKEQLFLTDVDLFISDMKKYYENQEKILLDTLNDLRIGLDRITTQNEYFAWIKRIGFYLIKRLSILIGGTEISRYTGEYLDIYYSLNNNIKHVKNLDTMIGDISSLTDYSNIAKDGITLYVPIPLWCGEHSGNALPMISLVYHDLEIDIEFESLDNCCYYVGQTNILDILHLGTVQYIVDYVHLDIDEREKFAQFSHEYLVSNVKEVNASFINTSNYTMDIDIFYSCRELYWILKENTIQKKYKLFNLYYPVHIHVIDSILNNNSNITDTVKLIFTNELHKNTFKVGNSINIKYSKYYDGTFEIIEYTSTSLVIKAKYAVYTNYVNRNYGIIYNATNSTYFNPFNKQNITFRGDDRTPYTDPAYYNYVIPYQYYSKTPEDGINSYSFALHPKKFQPSGSCNLSLINSKVLNIKLMSDYYDYINNNSLFYDIAIYGNTNNVLRITKGLSSLVFSA